MTEKAMPVIGLGNRIPCPVGHLGIDKNNARRSVGSVGVAPDVPVAARIVAGTARFLEPGVLIGSVVEDHFHDYSELPFVRRVEKILEILQSAVKRDGPTQ